MTNSQVDTEPVVSLKDVEVHYESSDSGILSLFQRSEDAVRAVDGVSFDIYENDIVAIVGESGCGKTTLGKTAIGLQKPTGGTVEYRGHDIQASKQKEEDISFENIRESLQIIHQDPGSSLNPNKPVIQSLSRPLKNRRSDLNRKQRVDHIYSFLEKVGMEPPEDYANRYPHQLSGGEKQRIALVRALLMNPDLILADEAVSALDVSLRIEMMDLMLDLQEQYNTSFLFISHNLSNARYFAGKADGKIGVMYLGKIVEVGPAEQIIQNPQHPYTKALEWSTPSLVPNSNKSESSPVRTIDIPDPADPPAGCSFHTRCPEAREECVKNKPELTDVGEDDGEHRASCFRNQANSDYWDSDSISE